MVPAIKPVAVDAGEITPEWPSILQITSLSGTRTNISPPPAAPVGIRASATSNIRAQRRLRLQRRPQRRRPPLHPPQLQPQRRPQRLLLPPPPHRLPPQRQRRLRLRLRRRRQ